jgi:hypothetical protein
MDSRLGRRFLLEKSFNPFPWATNFFAVTRLAVRLINGTFPHRGRKNELFSVRQRPYCGIFVLRVAMAGRLSLPISYMGQLLSQIGWNWIRIMRKRAISGKNDRANAEYFRFLGLRRGESDATTIRSAASAMSGLVSDCEGQFGVEGLVRRRSEIAVATYRLLDPRRRSSFFERVQLCYPADREERGNESISMETSAELSSNPWIEEETEQRLPVLMTLPVIERAIQEEAKNPATAQATAETMSWLDERREVIRSLREIEPRASKVSSSPITWIRSVLGW